MESDQIAAVIRFGQIGLRALSERVLTLLGFIACAALFGVALWMPNWERAAIASLFAALVYWPLVRLESRRQKEVPNE